MTALFAPLCSITTTRRRRFLWAAWWTAPPAREPFRRPDASSGGARTRAEALRDAERAAGQPLIEAHGGWARAWARVLVGKPPWIERPAAAEGATKKAAVPPRRSAWAILGLDPRASLEDIKRAFRARALETHPDRGGDAEVFREVHRAYEHALELRAKRARASRRR